VNFHTPTDEGESGRRELLKKGKYVSAMYRLKGAGRAAQGAFLQRKACGDQLIIYWGGRQSDMKRGGSGYAPKMMTEKGGHGVTVDRRKARIEVAAGISQQKQQRVKRERITRSTCRQRRALSPGPHRPTKDKMRAIKASGKELVKED